MGKELFSRSYADFSFDGMPRLFQTLSADMAQLIEQAGGRERFVGAGLSIPGTVENNRVLYSPELGLVDCDLAAVLQKELQMPVYIDKDVYLNALGENWMGSDGIILISLLLPSAPVSVLPLLSITGSIVAIAVWLEKSAT